MPVRPASGPGAEDRAGSLVLETRLLETRDMSGVMSVARKAAQLQIPVLITGETGTGKSMLARWLHRRSPGARPTSSR